MDRPARPAFTTPPAMVTIHPLAADSLRGPDCQLHRGGKRFANADGAVASEHGQWNELQRRSRRHQHHLCWRAYREPEWQSIPCRVHQSWWNGYIECRAAHRQHSGECDYQSGQPVDYRRTERDFHCGRRQRFPRSDGSVAGEHQWRRLVQRYRWRDIHHSDLYNHIGR